MLSTAVCNEIYLKRKITFGMGSQRIWPGGPISGYIFEKTPMPHSAVPYGDSCRAEKNWGTPCSRSWSYRRGEAHTLVGADGKESSGAYQTSYIIMMVDDNIRLLEETNQSNRSVLRRFGLSFERADF